MQIGGWKTFFPANSNTYITYLFSGLTLLFFWDGTMVLKCNELSQANINQPPLLMKPGNQTRHAIPHHPSVGRPAAADQWCPCVNGDIPGGLGHFDILRVRAQDKDDMFTGDLKHLKPIETKHR